MQVREFVLNSLYEDIGRGDIFERIATDLNTQAAIVSNSDGILAGVVYIKELANIVNLKINFLKNDSEKIKKGEIIAKIDGSYIQILKCERTMLNLLQHASGIATNTHRYIKELEGFDIILLDTRKTRPLLRAFEKYATRCGGARNHRFGLDDALMLKDTHLAHIHNLEEFVKKAKKIIPFGSKIEIECGSFEMAKEAFEAGADIVMCDNMNLDEIKRVVELRDKVYPHILIEASGGINIDNIKEFAKTGIDAISVGSLIHQATWLDFSMKIGSF